ncbi:MAG: hypothetical protein CME19_09455 [Gemmatimonadetes bacterium]|nr:hypothetical protein [Gemmatimonadota bacterium]
MFAIEHNRTFQFELEWTWYRRMRTIQDPAAIGVLYARYRSLPPEAFREALSPHLQEATIGQFLENWSIIIRYRDKKPTSYRIPSTQGPWSPLIHLISTVTSHG